MTAPDVRTLAEIVAEGRRLEAEQAEARRLIAALDPFGPDFAAALALGDAALAVGRFYRRHGPALLAVAEAAERFRVSGERWLEKPGGKPETEKEWEAMNDAREELFALLTGAAVRGEEKTNG